LSAGLPLRRADILVCPGQARMPVLLDATGKNACPPGRDRHECLSSSTRQARMPVLLDATGRNACPPGRDRQDACSTSAWPRRSSASALGSSPSPRRPRPCGRSGPASGRPSGPRPGSWSCRSAAPRPRW